MRNVEPASGSFDPDYGFITFIFYPVCTKQIQNEFKHLRRCILMVNGLKFEDNLKQNSTERPECMRKTDAITILAQNVIFFSLISHK